jgi:hypothetical protein
MSFFYKQETLKQVQGDRLGVAHGDKPNAVMLNLQTVMLNLFQHLCLTKIYLKTTLQRKKH